MPDASPTYPADLNQTDIDSWFPNSMTQPADDTFEIALVLGGTVSAGIYTAGVLDYLLEALDAWDEAKRSGQDVPQHKVVIRVICGASGGAINGIVFSRILAYQSERGAKRENPLYETWIDVSITDLLGGTDDKSFTSFLNVQKIDATADAMSKWGAGSSTAAAPGPMRPGLSDRLRVIATLTNITGFPYSINMGGQTGMGHSLTLMADWIRFVVDIPGGTKDDLRKWAPDERYLDRDAPAGWDSARDACLATSAFPAVFPARQVRRPEDFAAYRFACVPGDSTTLTQFRQLVPEWPLLLKNAPRPNLVTLNVDGGACNNEPIDIARRVLAGGDGRNPRQGSTAHRAVILIDPFSEVDRLGDTAPSNPFRSLMRLFGGLISQARYKPEDLALAEDEACFSRYLIAPVGPGPAPSPLGQKLNGRSTTGPAIGGNAIASGSLEGFGGFFSRDFRDYDFRLGRYNAQKFLQTYFMMPSTNSLFAGRSPKTTPANVRWQDTATDAQGNTQTFFAIIPVMPSVAVEPHPGFLPKISNADLDRIFDFIDLRVDWSFDRLKELASQVAKSGWMKKLLGAYLWIGWKLVGRSATLGAIKNYIDGELTSRGLK